MQKRQFPIILIMLFTVSGFLTACEKNQPSSPITQTTIKKYEKATLLHGTVSDDKGFVEHGTVKVTDSSGKVIANSTLQNSKNYSVEVPANIALPVLLTYDPEPDKDNKKSFTTVVIHPSITRYDINPLTTAIAKKALALGGYTDANMRQAADSASSVENSGKTSSVDQTKAVQHYGGWH